MREWIDSFHRDGFLVLPGILNADVCAELKEDLVKVYKHERRRRPVKRMFERSEANLKLFWQEPIVTFAENLIADNGSDELLPGEDLQSFSKGIPSANDVHVIHNNSFVIEAGREGLGLSGWHQDDTPHFNTIDGKPATNIRLNVLAITCLYYLTDVPDESYGPTQFIRGSHLFGLHCTNERAAAHTSQIVSALGPRGTCVIVNNQTWHRGSPNDSNVDRFVTQISYAKRLVGHKYGSFMNYTMPEHIVRRANDDRKRRLIGFFGHGAYG